MLFGVETLFLERDAHLLGADRIYVVVMFEHGVLPTLRRDPDGRGGGSRIILS
jgi:hypothetical protein